MAAPVQEKSAATVGSKIESWEAANSDRTSLRFMKFVQQLVQSVQLAALTFIVEILHLLWSHGPPCPVSNASTTFEVNVVSSLSSEPSHDHSRPFQYFATKSPGNFLFLRACTRAQEDVRTYAQVCARACEHEVFVHIGMWFRSTS